RIDSAAELERADFLEVLALEVDRSTAPIIQCVACHDGRPMNPRGDPLGRPPNVLYTDGNWGRLGHSRFHDQFLDVRIVRRLPDMRRLLYLKRAELIHLGSVRLDSITSQRCLGPGHEGKSRRKPQ